MPNEYFEEVKQYLRITFDDQDSLLLELIADGMAALKSMLYPKLEFNQMPVKSYDGQVNALLKDYVRYSWNGSTQYFEDDYGKVITRLSLQIGAEVML